MNREPQIQRKIKHHRMLFFFISLLKLKNFQVDSDLLGTGQNLSGTRAGTIERGAKTFIRKKIEGCRLFSKKKLVRWRLFFEKN